MTDALALLRRVPRWGALAWVVLLAAVLGRVAFAKPTSGTVMPIYLTAGARWADGLNVYAPAPPHDVFRNPPGVAAFFAPWALLPEKTAGVLWRAVSALVYLTGLVRWVRTLPLDGVTDRRLGWFAFLSALLIIPSFNNGQVNVVLLGALLHGTVEAGRGYLWRAGAWVAFATFFKLYPLAYGLLLCVVHPRFALRLVPMLLLFAAAPFALQRPEHVWDLHVGFVEFMEFESRFRLLLARWPWDWTMIPRAWLGADVPTGTAQVVAAAAGLAFAALVAVARRRGADAAFAAFSLGCVWMTLFGPATENATYALLAPVAAARVLLGRPLGLAAAALLSATILRGLFPTSEVLPLRTAQPFAAAVLLLATAADVFRPAAAARRPHPLPLPAAGRAAA